MKINRAALVLLGVFSFLTHSWAEELPGFDFWAFSNQKKIAALYFHVDDQNILFLEGNQVEAKNILVVVDFSKAPTEALTILWGADKKVKEVIVSRKIGFDEQKVIINNQNERQVIISKVIQFVDSLAKSPDTVFVDEGALNIALANAVIGVPLFRPREKPDAKQAFNQIISNLNLVVGLRVEAKGKMPLAMGQAKLAEELSLGLLEMRRKLRYEHSPRQKGISKDTRIKAIERHGCSQCP